ncbi:MAG TPA: fucose isomerase, partial [Anaerolineae bacterium]|nr:fucose isomerase [Anaerolineae bacterium]
MESTGIRLGLVSLARPTFDIPLATRVAAQARSQLERAGFSLTGPETLVTDVSEARKATQELAINPPDLLLVFQATFADSTMVMSLAREVDAPLLLWAVPEVRAGGRLRLNSLCGINLAAHALKRTRCHYDFVYAAADDPAALERVRTVALAGRVRRLLRQARVGRIGEHPDGMETCRFDKDALKRFLGVEVVPIELERVFQRVRTTDPQQIDVMVRKLSTKLDGLHQLDQVAFRGTLGVYVTLRQLVDQEGLNGLAVRCWPEFFTELGAAACGASSLLNDELIPASCEADVNGAVTQLLLQWLSGEPAFGSDLVAVDKEEDVAVLWHCGKAPLSMADPTVRPRGTIHSNRRLPLLMEFPLKPGRVTLARLSEATGSYRLVVSSGEVLRASISFSGTSGVLRFDRPAIEVLNTILDEGLEHHLSLTY